MKQIEETFSIKFNDGQSFRITARNYNEHYIWLTGNNLYLTTEYMRELANHLLRTADKIDADEVFNPKK